MRFKRVLFFFIIIQIMSVANSNATALTDAFIKDSNSNNNPWDEVNAYAPYPILFVHGFNSHCNTWGGPDDPDRLTINNLKEYFTTYQKYDDASGSIQLSCPDDKGRTSISVYKHTYLETIEFSNNLGHPRDQAKELARRITGKSSIGWPYPKDSGESILQEYYTEHYPNNPPQDKLILVAHSMGGLSSREYLTNSVILNVIGGNTHVSKLIMIGSPNFGSILGTIGAANTFMGHLQSEWMNKSTI